MNKDFSQALEKEQNTAQPSDILAVSEESSLEYVEGVLNIIWFSDCGIGFPIAQKLLEEGNNVVIGYVQNLEKPEDPEVRRRRLSLYDGILVKEDIEKVLKQMAKIENKDDWIVMCDFNSLAPWAERALALGFTKGFFPLEEDLELEKDRDAAKDIVREYYPDLTCAEVEEFTSAHDGIKFLEETDKVWVLKGNSDNAKTLVPWNDDPELAKQILIDALEAHSKDYEDGGFILEEKIIGGLEITPQMVWLDGKVVFTDIDFENKTIGSGNMSVQTGAMQTLVVKTKIRDKINKIAFPEWIHEKAKEHKGLFVADAGIIVKDDTFYFTEFCFQRWGFDSVFAEIDMAGSVTEWLSRLLAGDNPLKADFGVAVRGMNMHKDDKERRVLEGITMVTEDPDHTYIFECKEEENKLACTGCGWDLVVFTGSGSTINEASKKAYETSEKFAFEDLLVRPEFDFMSLDYPTAIMNRFNGLNHELFEAREAEDHEKYQNRVKMQDMERRLNDALKDE